MGFGETFELRSESFAPGGRLPERHVMPEAGGRNLSPALAWRGAPEDTRSYALTAIDEHPVADRFPHWLVYDMPPETTALAEGASGTAMPGETRELPNGFRRPGWGGPRPPRGSGEHEYRFMLFALDVPHLDISPTADADELAGALEGHTLASAHLSAYFGR